MIREIMPSERQQLFNMICGDNGRNYFIRLGLESDRPVFEKIFGEWDEQGQLRAALFKRLSGNLQFFAEGEFDVAGFSELLKSLDYEYLISPASFCDAFSDSGLFDSEREGGYIAMLRKEEWMDPAKSADFLIEPITAADLPEIVELYREVFHSFSPEAVMRKKLETGRGRGVCIREGSTLVSLAQSEFEDAESAVIVGVATAKGYERRGLAGSCMAELITELTNEGKNLILQYDNPDAGMLYQKLGFQVIDRVKHYEKKREDEKSSGLSAGDF